MQSDNYYVGFCIYLQVSVDGYFSFGRPVTCCPSLTANTSGSDYIIAPYLADTNIGSGRGNVSYEVHTLSTSPDLLSRVNSFIRQQKRNKFAGTWMLVAEWRNVPQSGQADSMVRKIIIMTTSIVSNISPIRTTRHASPAVY